MPDTSGFPKIGCWVDPRSKELLAADIKRHSESGVATLLTDEEPNAVMTVLLMGQQAPKHMTLGTGWTPPNRHPTCLDGEARALHKLCDGRATLGVAMHGAGSTKVCGFDWSGRHERLRDYMRATRACLDQQPGKKVNYQGKYYQVVDFGSYGSAYGEMLPVPPLCLKVIEVEEMATAGETCDGLTVGQMMPWAFYEKVGSELVRRAAEKAGRDPSKIAVSKLATTVVDDDSAAAVKRLKGAIATTLVRETFDFKRVAIEAGFADEVRAIGERMKKDDKKGAAEAVSEAMWRSYGLAGTPDEVREQAAAYAGKVDTLVVMGTMFGSKDLDEYLIGHYKAIKTVTADRT
jgi:alkanesulfonate monooxygenase SsuD/methylene tetrahydromethanopterin reductase-like flavin-dependent oxidoreductase (luciferase family)